MSQPRVPLGRTHANARPGVVPRRMQQSIVWRGLACVVLGLALSIPISLIADDRDTSGDQEQIRIRSRAFSKAYVDGELATLGDIYTADAVLLPPGGEFRGREAIRNYFTLGPDRRQLAHSMQPDEILVHGNVATDVGTWTSTWRRGEEEPRTASGRYLIVWMKDADGVWRIHYDMWHRPQQ